MPSGSAGVEDGGKGFSFVRQGLIIEREEHRMLYERRNHDGSWRGNGNAAPFSPGDVGRAVHLEGLLGLEEIRERSQRGVGPVPSAADGRAQREKASISAPNGTFAGDAGRDNVVSWIFRILGK